MSGSFVFVLVSCWSVVPFPWLLTPMLLRHSVRKTWTSLLLLLMNARSFVDLRLNESFVSDSLSATTVQQQHHRPAQCGCVYLDATAGCVRDNGPDVTYLSTCNLCVRFIPMKEQTLI